MMNILLVEKFCNMERMWAFFEVCTTWKYKLCYKGSLVTSFQMYRKRFKFQAGTDEIMNTPEDIKARFCYSLPGHYDIMSSF